MHSGRSYLHCCCEQRGSGIFFRRISGTDSITNDANHRLPDHRSWAVLLRCLDGKRLYCANQRRTWPVFYPGMRRPEFHKLKRRSTAVEHRDSFGFMGSLRHHPDIQHSRLIDNLRGLHRYARTDSVLRLSRKLNRTARGRDAIHDFYVREVLRQNHARAEWRSRAGTTRGTCVETVPNPADSEGNPSSQQPRRLHSHRAVIVTLRNNIIA